jgi:hypothetical protein
MTTATTYLSLLLIATNLIAIAFLLKIEKRIKHDRDKVKTLGKLLTEYTRVRSHNDGPTTTKPPITPKPQFPSPRKIKEDFC